MASFDHIISFHWNVIMNNRTLPPLFFSLVIFVAHSSGLPKTSSEAALARLCQLLELCPQDIPRPERQAYKEPNNPMLNPYHDEGNYVDGKIEKVTGQYSYVDPTGALVTVSYTAGPNGYSEHRTVQDGFVSRE